MWGGVSWSSTGRVPSIAECSYDVYSTDHVEVKLRLGRGVCMPCKAASSVREVEAVTWGAEGWGWERGVCEDIMYWLCMT